MKIMFIEELILLDIDKQTYETNDQINHQGSVNIKNSKNKSYSGSDYESDTSSLKTMF